MAEAQREEVSEEEIVTVPDNESERDFVSDGEPVTEGLPEAEGMFDIVASDAEESGDRDCSGLADIESVALTHCEIESV